MSKILFNMLNIFTNVKIDKTDEDMNKNKSTKTVLYTRFMPGDKYPLSAFPDGKELRFVHIDHSGAGQPGQNFIQIARKDAQAKDIVVALANRGFMAYA